MKKMKVKQTNFFILFILIFSTFGIAQEKEMEKSAFIISDNSESLVEDYSFRERPTILVLPFLNANTVAKESELGKTISVMMATALRNKTNFMVVAQSELDREIVEQILNLSGLNREIAQKLAKKFLVEVILIGDVSLINQTLHIDARLIETESAKVSASIYGSCHNLKAIRSSVEKLAIELEQTYLRQWMGSLSLTSQPCGAEVYLDDIFIGLTDEKTPLIIHNLLEGIYRLKLILGGYNDWDDEVVVLAKMERSIRIPLSAKPGSINIYSEPADVQVFIDNTFMGNTPMSLKKVAEGEHEIRLVKENYKEWNRKVVVRSFQPTDVKATLEISPGKVSINSIPSKANIYFKGKFVATTPYILSNIPPGEIVIRVEKPGYEEWTKSTVVQPNGHEILNANLKEKSGSLSIFSHPIGASIYLTKKGKESQRIGKSPLLNYSTIIGQYTVEIEKDDYFSIRRQNIFVEHNQLTELNFELQEKPGTILVETTPINARIFLDEKYRGRSPIHIRDIPRGEYRIKISLPYAEKTKTITVETNRQTQIKESFKKPNRYLIPMTMIGTIGLVFHFLAK